jgi:hypothetical protein
MPIDITTRAPRLLAMACAGLSLMIAAGFTSSVYAEPNSANRPPMNQNGEGRPHGPPPEALDACKNKKDGDVCQFNSPHGDVVSGTCWAPQGKPLACKPANAPK